jgi:pimeloyl-ACP methyl ester carboxylesterase
MQQTHEIHHHSLVLRHVGIRELKATETMKILLLHALPLDERQWTRELQLYPIESIAPRLYSLGSSLEQWARAVLETVGRERLIVVGNSVGGSCALEIARLAPRQVEALLLMGTKAGHRPEPEFSAKFIESLDRDPSGTVFRWVEELLAPNCAPAIRERVHTIAQSQAVDDLIRGVRVFHMRPDAADVVANWKRPLIWIRGSMDRVQTAFSEFRESQIASDRIAKNAKSNLQRSIILPDCGHFVNLEQPQSFREILQDVLANIAENACL